CPDNRVLLGIAFILNIACIGYFIAMIRLHEWKCPRCTRSFVACSIDFLFCVSASIANCQWGKLREKRHSTRLTTCKSQNFNRMRSAIRDFDDGRTYVLSELE